MVISYAIKPLEVQGRGSSNTIRNYWLKLNSGVIESEWARDGEVGEEEGSGDTGWSRHVRGYADENVHGYAAWVGLAGRYQRIVPCNYDGLLLSALQRRF